MSEVLAYTVTRSIASVKASREALMERHFSKGEREAFATRPAQTIAGQLALKAAVGELLEVNGIFKISSSSDIEIGRAKAGGPVLESIAGLDRAGWALVEERLHLSVSHSRSQAVGLAVWQAAGAEDE